jgi:regulator of protease activity HflC (stomatin/prohibitin superfamily)
MFLILFAAVLFASSYFAVQVPQLFRLQKPLRLAAFLVLITGLLFSAIKQIEPGEVGVQSLFGKVQGGTLGSGLHFVNPLAKITTFDARTQNYTMSAIHDEGNKNGDDAIRILTADGLEVIIDLTVLYKIDASQAAKIYQQIGEDYVNKVVRPIARTKIRDNAVYYDAISLYSTKRDEFQTRIFKTIESDFKNRGIVLEQLLVRNIALPTSVKQTIESKINAEQDAQKMLFTLNKERLEADRKRVEAQGIADYQKIVSSTLNDKQLQYERIVAMKELAKSANAKVLIMDGKTPVILDGK